jgi:uncharacterized protein
MEQGIVAVFPLPNLVFFPQTELPLHIFEPRYCEMITDTIQNQQLIGMFLLQPGWQDDYYGNPPVHPIGCAGEMIHIDRLPEGKFNIVLRGIARVRALESVQDSPYRKVRVEVLPEVVSKGETKIQALKQDLLRDFKIFARYMEATEMEEDWEFSRIVHGIASVLPVDLEVKRMLLEQDDLYARALSVKEHLASRVAVLKLTGRFAHLRPTDPNQN